MASRLLDSGKNLPLQGGSAVRRFLALAIGQRSCLERLPLQGCYRIVLLSCPALPGQWRIGSKDSSCLLVSLAFVASRLLSSARANLSRSIFVAVPHPRCKSRSRLQAGTRRPAPSNTARFCWCCASRLSLSLARCSSCWVSFSNCSLRSLQSMSALRSLPRRLVCARYSGYCPPLWKCLHHTHWLP